MRSGKAWMLSLVLLGGCMTHAQITENKEDLLAAAGFRAYPASTASRQAMLRTLPPDRFTRRARDNQFVYLFPDPLVCNCLYIGDDAAYGRYRQEVLARRLVNDQLLAAQLNSEPGWDWGPWGPVW